MGFLIGGWRQRPSHVTSYVTLETVPEGGGCFEWGLCVMIPECATGEVIGNCRKEASDVCLICFRSVVSPEHSEIMAHLPVNER